MTIWLASAKVAAKAHRCHQDDANVVCPEGGPLHFAEQVKVVKADDERHQRTGPSDDPSHKELRVCGSSGTVDGLSVVTALARFVSGTI